MPRYSVQGGPDVIRKDTPVGFQTVESVGVHFLRLVLDPLSELLVPVSANHPYQLPCLVPQVAGFRRTPVLIRGTKKGELVLLGGLVGPRRKGTCRKVDARLPGKGNSNSHGARPVHPIITTIKWFRTSRLSTKNSLSAFGLR